MMLISAEWNEKWLHQMVMVRWMTQNMATPPMA
jgi:hypothetical protein